MPRETPGSPFSTLLSVVRLISARSAIVAVGMRRRRRASRRSAPTFVRACRTGSGSGLLLRRIPFILRYAKEGIR